MRDEILDEFLAFIQDEDHAILISSHITSDLEKIADYITYIHQGRVVLSDSKDAILEHYAKLGCTQAQLRDIQPGDLVRVRKGSFGCEALVRDRAAFARKYPGLMLDRVTLEDIMLLIGKGSRHDRPDDEGCPCDAEDPEALCPVPVVLLRIGRAGRFPPCPWPWLWWR